MRRYVMLRYVGMMDMLCWANGAGPGHDGAQALSFSTFAGCLSRLSYH